MIYQFINLLASMLIYVLATREKKTEAEYHKICRK